MFLAPRLICHDSPVQYAVFWHITPKRCDVKHCKKRHNQKVGYQMLINSIKFNEFVQKNVVNKEKHSLCFVCSGRNPQPNRTSGCVTTPDLGDSLWQEHNNPQFLKIDKLVYSHAVNCLISRLTNHKLKVNVFPTTSLCSCTWGQVWN